VNALVSEVIRGDLRELYSHCNCGIRRLVTYRETLVGLVCIMNLGGIAMGFIWDCHVIAMGLNLGGIALRRNSGSLETSNIL